MIDQRNQLVMWLCLLFEPVHTALVPFPTTHLQPMSMPFYTVALAPLLLTVTLMPLPISARPVASFALASRQNASALIEHDVMFGIAFSLALFIALLRSFSRLASLWTAGAEPGEFFNRLCVAFSRQLSVFGRFTFIEGAAATFLDANNARTAFVPRRGGASYPVATVPGGMQAGGPRRVGVVRGSGDRLTGAPPIHAVV